MQSSSLQPPSTYAQWVSLLDLLKERSDDPNVLQAMQAGTIHWQDGVAERFSRKLIDAVNARMNSAVDRFQKEMSRSRGQEREIVSAILNLRNEMRFLSKAIRLPALPEKDRQSYYQLVLSQANSIQESLEKSAKTDRTGKLLSIIKTNRVNDL